MNSQNDSLPEISLPVKQTLEYYDYGDIWGFLKESGSNIDFWDVITDRYEGYINNGGYTRIWCSDFIDNDKIDDKAQEAFLVLQRNIGDDFLIYTSW